MSKTPRTTATHWGLALQGPAPAEATRWLAQACFAGRTPVRQSVAYERGPVADDWLAKVCEPSRDTQALYFNDEGDEYLIVHPSGTVSSRFPFAGAVPEALHLLEAAPFEVASFESLHDWSAIARSYRAPSFSRNHFPHGWGCAFKGAGHARLVSRRWLDFGPWKLHRGAQDLSLVQFHASQASAREALAQAKPGHALMGIGEQGGYLQQPYVFEHAISGLYDRDEHMLRVVVLGRRLTPVEVQYACAALQQGALSTAQPLKRVAYVFPDPDEAQVWLHALWLRGLECWTIVGGVERRLDADHHPTPVPPSWAQDM